MESNGNLLGLSEVHYDPNPSPRRLPKGPLNVLGVALAVFLGNILTAVVGALLYALLK